eukprot:CAMPEP_0119313676 /NCGR_PEP_ID=MMETSP1333-20130426/29989_1 /TAXON_ID=418940 /ORGANISM="Scyphosphaera apsteinii, Strain RCC1455" /LENGTH=483 /DNA_ID=CAMNT_0007318573 /DNA_START=83 /DNA_END=1534 /DNA_ORIENTATION=+
MLLASVPVAHSIHAPLTSEPAAISRAIIEDSGRRLAVHFSDGFKCRFHSLWLRDACRDEMHVVQDAGERLLTATPVGPSGVCPDRLRASSAELSDPGGSELRVIWNADSILPSRDSELDPPTASTFQANFLRSYAEVVAETIEPSTLSDGVAASLLKDDLAWLRPFSGFKDTPAQPAEEMHLWRNDGTVLPVYDYYDVLDVQSTANLRMLQDMVRFGAVIIDGCTTPGVEALHHFADTALGGLQKDPTRPESNWKILKKDGATSVSYDHLKRLNQHTDSSIPPHGLPALCLLMHYADGSGTNTLTDGFAVANQLRDEDPDGYELLAAYGYDGERDFVASRVDSTQTFNRGLVVSTQFPLLQLDGSDNLKRIQYNEVFRMPSTLPFHVFPHWYAAFNRFVELVHSDEFERKIPMHKGRFLLMHNWRVLHGRAGGMASSNRVLVGGTITREAFYSQARRLTREQRGFSDLAQEEELVLRGVPVIP